MKRGAVSSEIPQSLNLFNFELCLFQPGFFAQTDNLRRPIIIIRRSASGSLLTSLRIKGPGRISALRFTKR
jgi:hypothetical protein